MKCQGILLLTATATTSAFLAPQRITTRGTTLSVTRDQFLQPHYHVPQPVTSDVSRMAECANESGLCSIEEMTQYLEGRLFDDEVWQSLFARHRLTLSLPELEDLNRYCGLEEDSPTCTVDEGQAREDLRQALAQQVEAQQRPAPVEPAFSAWKDNLEDRLSHLREIAEYESH